MAVMFVIDVDMAFDVHAVVVAVIIIMFVSHLFR